MKLTITAALLATALASPAYADCLEDLNKAGMELGKDKRVTAQYRSSMDWRRSYDTLARAARTFARAGMDDRCQDVVKGMRELAEKRTDDKDDKDKADRKEKDTRDTAEKRKQQRMAYLSAAKPMAKASVSVESLTGVDVRNMRDEDLGDVDDVILRSSGNHEAIIGRGGFIGMGVNHYRVPFNKLKIQTGNDDYSPVVVLNVDAKALEAMPKVVKKDGRWINEATKKRVEDDDDDDEMKKDKK